MLVTSIFSFSHNVFHQSQTEICFKVSFILSSANAFNLDQSKNLSFGKVLKGQLSFVAESVVYMTSNPQVSGLN